MAGVVVGGGAGGSLGGAYCCRHALAGRLSTRRRLHGRSAVARDHPTPLTFRFLTTPFLLSPSARFQGIALLGCFLFCFFGAYMGTNWVPSMLDRAKFDVGTASYGLLAWNLGVLVFALVAAFVIPRIGSRVTMLTLAAGSVAGCVTLAMMNITPAEVVPVFIMLGITGGMVNATQTTMYALAAN